MNRSSQWFLSRDIQAGFFSPVDSLKFFARHKFLLVMGMAPHALGLVGYLWFLLNWVYAAAERNLTQLSAFTPGSLSGMALQAALVIFGLVTYTLIGLPVISVLASPLFDLIAEKAYIDASGRTLPKPSFADFFRSFVSECAKTLIILAFIVLSFFLPLMAPVGFLVSIWFFGWDHMDRTLSLKGMTLGPRLLFGIKHFPACLALGLWVYIPFAGTLLTFAMSAAGAIAVAKIESPADVAATAGAKPPL